MRNDELVVTVERLRDIDSLGNDWRELEHHAERSLFLTWAWVGTWLALLPKRTDVMVLTGHIDNRVVALGVLCRRWGRRRGVISSTGVFLHETGDPSLDCLTVEHNGFLLDARLDPGVFWERIPAALARWFHWDEMYFSGVNRDTKRRLERWAARSDLKLVTIVRKRGYFVDLSKLSGRDAYLAGLSKNARYQIRRTLRAFGEDGEVGFYVAETPSERQLYLSELSKLHQSYWTSKGFSGSFSRPFFSEFHERVCGGQLAGRIAQLCMVTCGDRPIGYLLNFMVGDRVYNYQSGFEYSENNNYRPGLVAHYMAITHNIEAGTRIYDFLAGKGRHKSRMANGSYDLEWIVLQKRKFRFSVERVARRTKQSVEAYGQRFLSSAVLEDQQ